MKRLFTVTLLYLIQECIIPTWRWKHIIHIVYTYWFTHPFIHWSSDVQAGAASLSLHHGCSQLWGNNKFKTKLKEFLLRSGFKQRDISVGEDDHELSEMEMDSRFGAASAVMRLFL